MSSIIISDLSGIRTLEHGEMSAVSGGAPGNSWLAGLGPVANVNIGVNQNITQMQFVNVEALNNIGVIGAGFVAPNLNVSPKLWASTNAAV
ncbi:hypothetical protein KZJ38_29930 [Paraburkholderia edwinii]|uniref:Uncharacterized protein n=1 Tax=Paraburkholderia edwinii TaxID=2861782 RepID=A0ABX8UQK1_9BURK|nr:hypothetical protein [Paraburkholderia edwinii]QYD71265.1 hypothetical protein KZJ38_29930 [Paraburkholderia edwinii]